MAVQDFSRIHVIVVDNVLYWDLHQSIRWLTVGYEECYIIDFYLGCLLSSTVQRLKVDLLHMCSSFLV